MPSSSSSLPPIAFGTNLGLLAGYRVVTIPGFNIPPRPIYAVNDCADLISIGLNARPSWLIGYHSNSSKGPLPVYLDPTCIRVSSCQSSASSLSSPSCWLGLPKFAHMRGVLIGYRDGVNGPAPIYAVRCCIGGALLSSSLSQSGQSLQPSSSSSSASASETQSSGSAVSAASVSASASASASASPTSASAGPSQSASAGPSQSASVSPTSASSGPQSGQSFQPPPSSPSSSSSSSASASASGGPSGGSQHSGPSSSVTSVAPSASSSSPSSSSSSGLPSLPAATSSSSSSSRSASSSSSGSPTKGACCNGAGTTCTGVATNSGSPGCGSVTATLTNTSANIWTGVGIDGNGFQVSFTLNCDPNTGNWSGGCDSTDICFANIFGPLTDNGNCTLSGGTGVVTIVFTNPCC